MTEHRIRNGRRTGCGHQNVPSMAMCRCRSFTPQEGTPVSDTRPLTDYEVTVPMAADGQRRDIHARVPAVDAHHARRAGIDIGMGYNASTSHQWKFTDTQQIQVQPAGADTSNPTAALLQLAEALIEQADKVRDLGTQRGRTSYRDRAAGLAEAAAMARAMADTVPDCHPVEVPGV